MIYQTKHRYSIKYGTIYKSTFLKSLDFRPRKLGEKNVLLMSKIPYRLYLDSRSRDFPTISYVPKLSLMRWVCFRSVNNDGGLWDLSTFFPYLDFRSKIFLKIPKPFFVVLATNGEIWPLYTGFLSHSGRAWGMTFSE